MSQRWLPTLAISASHWPISVVGHTTSVARAPLRSASSSSASECSTSAAATPCSFPRPRRPRDGPRAPPPPRPRPPLGSGYPLALSASTSATTSSVLPSPISSLSRPPVTRGGACTRHSPPRGKTKKQSPSSHCRSSHMSWFKSQASWSLIQASVCRWNGNIVTVSPAGCSSSLRGAGDGKGGDGGSTAGSGPASPCSHPDL